MTLGEFLLLVNLGSKKKNNNLGTTACPFVWTYSQYSNYRIILNGHTIPVIGPMGMAGLFFTNYPPIWEKIPPVEDPGLCDPPGEPGWLSW